MGLFNKKNRLNTKLNAGVDGGNSTEFHEDRVVGLIQALTGSGKSDLDQNIVSTDSFRTTAKKGGRQVSLETLDRDTRGQQEALDALVESENLGHGAEAPKTRGIAPCILAKQAEDGRTNFIKTRKEG